MPFCNNCPILQRVLPLCALLFRRVAQRRQAIAHMPNFAGAVPLLILLPAMAFKRQVYT